MRELRPCEAAFAALGIERLIEFLKIPTKPLIGTGERKCSPVCVSRRAGHEALWRAAQPAKHKKRMLTCGVPPFRHACERRRTNWVIVTLRVQCRGLIPQLLGNTLPTQGAIVALRIECVEQRGDVELDLHILCRWHTLPLDQPAILALVRGDMMCGEASSIRSETDMVLMFISPERGVGSSFSCDLQLFSWFTKRFSFVVKRGSRFVDVG